MSLAGVYMSKIGGAEIDEVVCGAGCGRRFGQMWGRGGPYIQTYRPVYRFRQSHRYFWCKCRYIGIIHFVARSCVRLKVSNNGNNNWQSFYFLSCCHLLYALVEEVSI